MILRTLRSFLVLVFLANAAQGQDSEVNVNAAFWDSVYTKNHVLDIQIRITRADWTKMEPENQRGGGQRGGGQRGRGPGGPGAGGPPGRRPPGGPGGGPPPFGRGAGGPGGGDSNEYTYVKSKIIVDGQTFDDAGLRFKGNSSYRFASRGMKRPMKIDMNRFKKGQKLHGRTKLNLSNAFLDSAFMKEKLAYDLYESAGLATPGVGWANVTLVMDGKKIPLGVYVVIEQVNKGFLEDHFGAASRDSLLMKPEIDQWDYLGEDTEAYSKYEIKYGQDNVDQIRRFAELLKLVEDASDDVFEKEIGDRIDLPQLAGYLAATSLLASIDSYVGMPHNYYLLMDKADGKLRMLPWDVNEGFGTFTMGSSAQQLVDWDIDRPWVANRPLLERLFETKSFPSLYRSALKELMTEFTEEKLFGRIAEYEKTIAPHVGKYKAGAGRKGLKMGIEGDRSGFNRAVERNVLAIKPFIAKRIESVQSQLSGESEGQTIRGRRRR